MLLALLASLAQATPVLTHDPIPSGGLATLVVDGALAGERVHFVAARNVGSGPCYSALGGECLDVTSPHVLGSATTDGAGHAELDFFFPTALTPGSTIQLQAAIPRGVGGVDSVLTPVVAAVVAGGVDSDGDGHDVGTDCDDTDPDVHPGAVEICDGVDNDCDAATSEDGLVSVGVTNYASVADGVYYAPPGDDVRVCAGTYSEALVATRSVRIIGVAGPAATIIDASGTGAATLLLSGPGDYHIEGVTLTGGNSGLVLGVDTDTTVAHAVITGNYSVSNEGGGIRDDSYYWDPSTLTMEDVEVSYNTSDWEGGGAYLGNGANTLIDVRFLFNEGLSGGGGLFLGDNAGVTTLIDCTFHGNFASGTGTGLDGGGGVLMNDQADDLVVTNSDFGVGANENIPSDVGIYDPNGSAAYTWFQAGETFTCSTSTVTCQ